VHDRRIDGKAHTFGNAGGLMMNAMTWWDHETESIWSQPWGRAIDGPLKGIELFLLPSQVTTWAAWRAEHPDSLAMINDADRLGFRQKFDPDFVIGLLLDGRAQAYPYRDVEKAGVVNDAIGDIPIFVWAAGGNFHAYIRVANDRVLTFQLVDDVPTDVETGSTWDITRGLATAGPLRGENLQPVPGSTAYDWAWLDFYPDSGFYEPAS